MSALAAAAGISLGAAQLAALCEAVEVCVVGAPCGPYDQLVAACAVEGELIVADVRSHAIFPLFVIYRPIFDRLPVFPGLYHRCHRLA